MSGVSVVVECADCGAITAEVAYRPENYEGWLRHCHRCGHQGLVITLVHTRPGWTPDPESDVS